MQKYQFNITVKDKILNKLFNDIRFRQAMSLAIDRTDINQTLFLDWQNQDNGELNQPLRFMKNGCQPIACKVMIPKKQIDYWMK